MQKKLFDIRSQIIKAFENGIFSSHKENLHKEELHKEQTKEEKKRSNPCWIKGENHTFDRIRERVNNYLNKGWHSKVNSKSITMNPVKHFLQNIVSGKFNNAEEARKFYLDNVYGDKQKLRKLDNQTDRNKDMIEAYDQVKEIITPTVVNMDYNKSDDGRDNEQSDNEADNGQVDTTNVSDLEGEESDEKRKKTRSKRIKNINSRTNA